MAPSHEGAVTPEELAGALSAWIDEYYESVDTWEPKPLIGASAVGNDCDAYLAYNLRGFPGVTPPPKLKRIFKLGHGIEDDVVEDIMSAIVAHPESGIKFLPNAPDGMQWGGRLYGGHFRGRADGLLTHEVDGETTLAEIKSLSEKNFKDFQKGLRGTKNSLLAKYHCQCVAMMGLMSLKRALLIAYCKNTSDYHVELIEFDRTIWDWLTARVELAMNGSARRVSDKPDGFRCRFCDKRTVCWTEDMDHAVARKCTTCRHSVASRDGKWFCNKHSKICSDPCDDWERYWAPPK